MFISVKPHIKETFSVQIQIQIQIQKFKFKFKIKFKFKFKFKEFEFDAYLIATWLQWPVSKQFEF